MSMSGPARVVRGLVRAVVGLLVVAVPYAFAALASWWAGPPL